VYSFNQISVNNVAFTFIPTQGDTNNDGVINILDLRTVAAYFDIKQGDSLWSVASAYDLNGNGVIDIYDLVLIAVNLT
jgi:Ca2+-binding EF-hand superfamily protein